MIQIILWKKDPIKSLIVPPTYDPKTIVKHNKYRYVIEYTLDFSELWGLFQM